MRSTNRKRALLVSGSVILLCMTIIVGMTWALFTDTRTLTNHLKAGDLSITLVRNSLTTKTLDGDGYLGTEKTYNSIADGGKVDFTEANNMSVFKLYPNGQSDNNNTETIVPGSSYSANMTISNNDSDVAFVYWMGVVINSTDEEIGDLSNLVTITVTDPADPTATPKAVDFSNKLMFIGSDADPIGTMEPGSAPQSFTVTLSFKDSGYTIDSEGNLSTDDNSAMGDNIDFDIVVYAVQKTTK